jgi:hypothetical protein
MTHLMKYLEYPKQFQDKARNLEIDCRRQERELIIFAKRLNSIRVKRKEDFLELEKMKDFLVVSAEMNTRTLNMLEWTHKLLQEISLDATAVIDGAKLRDQLKDNADTLESLLAHREKLAKEYAGR